MAFTSDSRLPAFGHRVATANLVACEGRSVWDVHEYVAT